MIDIDAYLRRIEYDGPLDQSPATLQQLQMAHLLTVPFENLDIALGREIQLDEPSVLRKIVDRRRGGFCYEANSAFAALLRALGFQVVLLSAGVAHRDGGFGPEFDHMTLLVQLDEPWLVDVGFGDSFRTPLQLRATSAQAQALGSYRLDSDNDHMILKQVLAGDWLPQYRFTLQPRITTDFAAMCHYHQTSPQSHFTQQSICTRATPDGRLTLSDRRLITTSGDERHELFVADEPAYHAALATYFGIVLDLL